jgi:hypothetical protein
MGHVTRLSVTQNDELKEDEMGNACNTHGEMMLVGFWLEFQKDRNY